MPANAYQFGDWLIEPAVNRVVSGDVERHLEPLCMDLLVYFLEHPDETIPAQRLLEAAWADRVVESNAVPRVVNQIRHALGDDSHHPRYIETIRKRGYRVVAPVEPLQAPPCSTVIGAPAMQQSGSRTGVSSRRYRFPPIGLAFALLLAASLFAWWILPVGGSPPQAAALVVAVLPVEDMAGDRHSRRLAQRVHQQLVHHLRRAPGTWMIRVRRNPQGADAIVNGALQLDPAELSVQLVRAADGSILWTKVLSDRGLGDTAALSAAAEYLANMIAVAVFSDRQGELQTASAEVRALYVRGLLEWQEAVQGVEGDPSASVAMLRRASELDPRFALAIQQLGMHYSNRLNLRLRAQDAVGPAHQYARRLLELSPDATFLLGTINVSLDLDYAAAQANFEHARRHGWPLGEIESELGIVLLTQGKLEPAIRRLRAAARVGAMTNRAAVSLWLARAYFAAGRYAHALATSADAVAASDGTALLHLASLRDRVIIAHHAGAPDVARSSLELAWRRYGSDRPDFFPAMVAAAGETKRARALLQLADEAFQRGELPHASESFWGHFYLGDADAAYLWLRRAIDNREFWLLPMLRRSEILAEFRSDRRFAEIMARLAHIEAAGTPTGSVAYRATARR